MTVVDAPLNVIDYAKEVQPHLFIGVPRIYEKIYSNLKSAIDSKSILKIGLKILRFNNLASIVQTKSFLFLFIFTLCLAAPIAMQCCFHSLDIPSFLAQEEESKTDTFELS